MHAAPGCRIFDMNSASTRISIGFVLLGFNEVGENFHFAGSGVVNPDSTPSGDGRRRYADVPGGFWQRSNKNWYFK